MTKLCRRSESGALDASFNPTHIISLGADCTISHNIRRYFGVDSAYPFDWWVTPHHSLELFLLKPDVDYLFDVKFLRLINGGDSITNSEIGIMYHHDFHRGEDNLICGDIEYQIENIKNKYRYLIERFLCLNNAGNNILFLRSGFEPDEFSKERLVGLLAARFPSASFCLHWVVQPDFGDFDWRGDPCAWDEKFENMNISFAPYLKGSD
jgi:hypothetical protein